MSEIAFNDFDQMFMQEAIKQAKRALENDEVPVGAVIVHDQKIIARAYNQVEMLKDPTAHAEMIAITQAASFMKSKWLHDCTAYVTLEPCSMCAGAFVLARVKRLVFAAKDPKAGAAGSVLNIAQHNHLNHRVELTDGIFAEQCGQMLSGFFQKKRKSADI